MVNTFLPFADFQKCAEYLDYRRLGKQRVEAKQIIDVIANPDAKAWRNHPAVTMWRGYTDALKLYFNTMVTEWIKRGYKNTMKLYDIPDKVDMPWWMGNKDFHYSHQASLIRKKSDYYKDKFDVPANYLDKGYVWPHINNGKQIVEFAPLSVN